MARTAQDGVDDAPPDPDLSVEGGHGSTIPEAETGPAPGRSAWDAKRIVLVAIGIAVAGFLFIKMIDDPKQFLVVTLNGVTLAALFFVVASGFTLIFGLMRVVNMAHGALYLFGGYIALEMQNKWFVEEVGGGGFTLGVGGAEDEATIGLLGWIIPLLLATAIIGIIGVDHPAGLPALEPGAGPAPGADHDRALGDLRRPDARRVRRHLQGHQDAVGLADLDHAPGRGPVRLLPRRRRARRGPADRRGALVHHQDARASARSCAPAWTTATWSPRSASTCS